MKPIQVFGFVFVSLLLLLAISFFFPENGLKTGPFEWSFPSWKHLLSTTSQPHDTLAHAIKTELSIIDTLTLPANNDTLPSDTSSLPISMPAQNDSTDTNAVLPPPIEIKPEKLKGKIYPFEWAQLSDRKPLFNFFNNLLKNNKLWHILHYGDSQIESDRITAFLRYHLQQKFKGSGPGLIPPVNFVNSFSIRQSHSDNWVRYSIMKKSSYPFSHGKYGLLLSFARYLPYHSTSNEVTTASLEFKIARQSYPNTRILRRVSMFYGQNEKSVLLQVFANNKLIDFQTLSPSDYAVYTTRLPAHTQNIRLKFVGSDSPDIYAVSFDDETGVAIDNIPIRGASGTFFTKLDFNHLKTALHSINVGLIFLEFGGNVLPYIHDSSAAERYGRYFASQIRRIKRASPSTPIIVLGVADMSIKSGTDFITYPLLEPVRDALRKAAFSTGCGYWDMYEAMGGKNSMPAWVNAGLAIKDYTHFTGKGANVMAHMLYNAFMKEYNDFVNEQRHQKP